MLNVINSFDKEENSKILKDDPLIIMFLDLS